MLPYIDFDVIKNNPKIYLGYSDSTITHFMCLKAGLRSYYGPSIMAGFTENKQLISFMRDSVKNTLFSTSIIGEISNNKDGFTTKQYPWEDNSFLDTPRVLIEAPERKLLQGDYNVSGRLIGGCLEVMECLKGTSIWPELNMWNDAIFFIETSEDMPTEQDISWHFRNYAAQGILQKLNGIIIGRPCCNDFDEDYYTKQEEQDINTQLDEFEELIISTALSGGELFELVRDVTINYSPNDILEPENGLQIKKAEIDIVVVFDEV